ncbi:MAG: hypothetical protein IPP72_19870 [Chitinophagaceae bacterium]|nr:hypothetical protein [Chitinophagaceae bacterium]
MLPSLVKYIKDISPTKIGMIAVLAIVILLPFLVDTLLLATGSQILADFSFTLFILKGFRMIAVGFIIYHACYYIISSIYQSFKKKQDKEQSIN